MERNTKRAYTKLPRQLWLIKPFDRVHGSKKPYNRQRLKRELFRELVEWGEGDAVVRL